MTVQKAFRTIIQQIGEDPDREGLADTPERAAKAMAFITRGYNQTLAQVVNGALFDSDTSEMVVVQDIELYSMCEHHILPFIGKCHVAYMPTGKVLGLSKVARIVEMFARRLQIQENLTKQIAEAIQEVTEAAGTLYGDRKLASIDPGLLEGLHEARVGFLARAEGLAAVDDRERVAPHLDLKTASGLRPGNDLADRDLASVRKRIVEEQEEDRDHGDHDQEINEAVPHPSAAH